MEDHRKLCGRITVDVFEDIRTGFHSFDVETDNEDLLPASYVIRDSLQWY